MPEALAHCAELVRAADRDRYLATLFAPAARRDALFALYAFNSEITRVPEVARETLPGEIRLQWWRDVLGGERGGEANANPVAAALLDTLARHELEADQLIDLIDAHRFDLYEEPMARIADLESYLRKTSSALIGVAAHILGGDAEAAAGPAGIAFGIAGLLRALPRHAARHQSYVPLEILDRHGVRRDDLFTRQSSRALNAALAELRDLARRHLAAARAHMSALPPEALPAFLPVALARPWLERLERSDPFASAGMSPWRRQWLIWRAARDPRRIVG